MNDSKKRQIAIEILALYNRAKKICEKKGLFIKCIRRYWEKNRILLSVSWKSFSDFQKEINNFCHEIQPSKNDLKEAQKRVEQEKIELGGGDKDVGEYFYELYKIA